RPVVVIEARFAERHTVPFGLTGEVQCVPLQLCGERGIRLWGEEIHPDRAGGQPAGGDDPVGEVGGAQVSGREESAPAGPAARGGQLGSGRSARHRGDDDRVAQVAQVEAGARTRAGPGKRAGATRTGWGIRHHRTALANSSTSCGSLPRLGNTAYRASRPSSVSPQRRSTAADAALSTWHTAHNRYTRSSRLTASISSDNASEARPRPHHRRPRQ